MDSVVPETEKEELVTEEPIDSIVGLISSIKLKIKNKLDELAKTT
tara:strand:- start:643 stop:777 length:135 start_codon:yes stop_codon:yes gene_type:complete